jgi:hypothetical protein
MYLTNWCSARGTLSTLSAARNSLAGNFVLLLLVILLHSALHGGKTAEEREKLVSLRINCHGSR